MTNASASPASAIAKRRSEAPRMESNYVYAVACRAYSAKDKWCVNFSREESEVKRRTL